MIAKARIEDVPQMHRLINDFASRGDMLPRALSQIYENIRDYIVLRDDDKVVGCAALHVNWMDLAEIRSLAVTEARQREGLGAALVAACVEEARSLGLPRVFCLTRRPEFFTKQDFVSVDKAELPHKIWAECYYCPKFPDCDEFALVRDLQGPEGNTSE
ncbi:MAG: N-acetyltransferase [Dehalococcoidia bacterium]|nr:N-acetyltransferase [Dehalococcoidia bacterium]